MAWEFERTFVDNLPYTPKDLLFDNPYLVVLAGQKIYGYDWWRDEHEDPDNIYLEPESTYGLTPTYEIDLSSHLVSIGDSFVSAMGSFYVFDAANHNAIVKCDWAGNKEVISLPERMSSNIGYGANKLWFASTVPDPITDEQLLYHYDLVTKEFGSTTIPATKTQSNIYISTDLNSQIVLTSFNNNAIIKFNAITGAYVSTIRVNREPDFIFVGTDKTVYVASTEQMISTVNTTTDVTAHYAESPCTATKGMGEVGGKLWFSGSGELGELTKSTKSLKFKGADQEDYKLSSSLFANTAFNRSVLTPTFDYDYWDGAAVQTKTIGEYFFVLGGNSLMGFKIAPRFRENYYKLNGVGMISSGPHDYTGE